MKLKTGFYVKKLAPLFFVLFAILRCATPVFCYPVTFTDTEGTEITIDKRPSRVVSLVPTITEIIFKIGAGDTVKAVTYHDTYPVETATKEIVGGFFSPSLKVIEKIDPDIIFVSRLHKKIRQRLGHGRCRLINLEANSISDIYRNINLLGTIFNKEKNAAKIIEEIRNELEIIARKVARIPQSERKRVIRLMGRDQVMTTGDDSFQNEYIRLAGGIPPRFGKEGNIAAVTKEEWMRFNPQAIYGCGGDRKTANRFFERPGWKDVDAVKNGKVFFFPCDLTCRASTRAGSFVSWLSARVYEDEFSEKQTQVLEDRVFRSLELVLDLDYVKDIRILYSTIHDFLNKTLIIDFDEPLSVVSTLEGERKGIESVGNHYSSPPCWGIGHKLGLKKIRKRVYEVIGKSEDTAGFLFTGADMDNLAIKREQFKEMEVYALVTAGVKSNAVRMSADEGKFYEPGTINIIILPNVRLSPRAMTRAIVSATEAKTAALQDLDIRSSYTPRIHQATGTGTDNILIVEGKGIPVDNSGGHSKMGELIAKAVYDAVQEAVYNQNGVTPRRNIFQRLKDRRISLFDLSASMRMENKGDRKKLLEALEEVLLQPRYASFVESSFAISDDYERGLIADLSIYELWCKNVAEEIAGEKIPNLKDVTETENMPPVLRMTVNALLNGIYHRSVSSQ
ncbi:MAG: adenosylcobinamide amidohydrolase [Desulfobacterales bacterium S5133MH4]|nr:MAG: adenosylcobinamide amidohydrolase [Desulfobacterales bacterium S5133MH4]